MNLEGIRVTSEVFWRATLLFGVVDLAFFFLWFWRVRASRFRLLKWASFVGALAVWLPIWTVLFPSFWESFYRFVMPPWGRWAYQFFGVVFPLIGLGFWWLALRIRGNPAINFALLGGLLGVGTHAWAIYGRNMLEKTELLRGVPAAPVLVFSFFEALLYWNLAVAIALLLRALWDRTRHTGHPLATTP